MSADYRARADATRAKAGTTERTEDSKNPGPLRA
jgi:hypothetical protein